MQPGSAGTSRGVYGENRADQGGPKKISGFSGPPFPAAAENRCGRIRFAFASKQKRPAGKPGVSDG